MLKKIRTVVVDDEPRLRRGVEKLVRAMGEEWEITGSYNSALECIETCQNQNLQFDLLITDVKMPGMDGLTLIHKLKELTEFHAIVISGYDDFAFLQTAIREGASDYLIKPIDRDEFRCQLEEVKKQIISYWNEMQEQKDIESKASQFLYMKQLQKLSELFWQQDIDLSHLEWLNDFPNGNYRLMYVNMDQLSRKKSFEKDDWSLWKFALNNIGNETANQLMQQSWQWSGEGLSLWILLHAETGNQIFDTMCVDLANKLRINIKKYTPFTCSVAFSRKFQDLTLLSSLRDEVLTYMQFRLIYGGNQTFSNELVDTWKVNQEENTSKEMENAIEKVIFSMKNNGADNTKQKISSFLKVIESLESPSQIEHSLHIFGIKVIDYMITHTKAKDGIYLLEELSTFITKTSNLFELRNKMYEWMKKVLLILEQSKTDMTSNPIEVAKQWILDHLDQNITIQKIADQVYLNPTYFCEYYKNQTGETVHDYVTRARLEKASELLMVKSLKIYDVSEMVGYADAKYFSKLFKKYYGNTPSKYKEKFIVEQS